MCQLLPVTIMERSHFLPQLLNGQRVALLFVLGLPLHQLQLLSGFAVLPLQVLEASLAGVGFLTRKAKRQDTQWRKEDFSPAKYRQDVKLLMGPAKS